MAQLFVLSLPGPARDGVRLFPSIWDRFVCLRLPCLQVRGKSKLRKCGKIAGPPLRYRSDDQELSASRASGAAFSAKVWHWPRPAQEWSNSLARTIV